jgi:hypothetical protein
MLKQLLILSATSLLFACNNSDTSNTVMTGDSGHITGGSDSTNTTHTNDASNGTESLSTNARSKWHSYGRDSMGSAWKTDDSTIHLDASVKNDWQTKNGGDIVSNEEYENFDLSLDWKIAKGGNSGIIFYVQDDTSKYKNTWETGMEMQVVDNERHPDGKIHKHQAGDLYDLIPISKKAFHPAGEWNHVEIISNNGNLVFNVNGEQVLQTTLWDDNWKKLIAGSKFKDMKDFGTFKKGRIALQDHGADVWYKNIQIKRL